MHSQLTDLKGAGTQKYNGQGVYRTGPKPQTCPGERCWLLRAAGLLFDQGPADTGIVSTYWFTLLFAIYIPLPISTLEGKTVLLSPFQYRWWLWTSLSNRCWQVLPALTWPPGGPESHSGERCMCNTQSLVLIVKALLKWTKLSESTQ